MSQLIILRQKYSKRSARLVAISVTSLCLFYETSEAAKKTVSRRIELVVSSCAPIRKNVPLCVPSTLKLHLRKNFDQNVDDGSSRNAKEQAIVGPTKFKVLNNEIQITIRSDQPPVGDPDELVKDDKHGNVAEPWPSPAGEVDRIIPIVRSGLREYGLSDLELRRIFSHTGRTNFVSRRDSIAQAQAACDLVTSVHVSGKQREMLSVSFNYCSDSLKTNEVSGTYREDGRTFYVLVRDLGVPK